MTTIKPKLLLTAIFKDDSEYDLAERMLRSFAPYVDGLAVAITGVSGQHTRLKSLIKRHNGRYIVTRPETHPAIYGKDEKGFFFANFAEARNESFKLASVLQQEGKYDFWLWADVDDVLINGQELPVCAAKAKEMQLDTVFFTYWYAVQLDEQGQIKDILIEHLRERLLRPDVFKWVSRLHEVAVPLDDKYQVKNSLYDYNPKEGRSLVWAHLANTDRQVANLQRNIQILNLQIAEEQHKDPRTIFYLAKTYYDIGTPEHLQQSEQLIYEYLKLSGWAEERSYAWEYVGNIRGRANDHRGAIEAYYNAIKEFPNRHMPYLLLAKEYAALGLRDESRFWTDLALKMDAPRTRTTIGNPLEVKVLAASLKYNDAISQQKLDEAIEWLKIRNQLLGTEDDGMLQTLEDAKLLNEAAIWVFNYAKWLKEKGYTEKIKHVLDSLPIELGREAFAYYMANELKEPKTWGEKDIVIYASFGAEHFEQWSGRSLSKGIGGSETAVIELARRWTQMGYNVTVYGDPREDEGVIDGVTYLPYYTINWKDNFHILILWRSPHLIDRVQSAKKLFMDLHDICSQLDWTDERMNKIDKVFFKSQAHRKMLPKLPDEKAAVISNGI